jgi:hypothetical protein
MAVGAVYLPETPLAGNASCGSFSPTRIRGQSDDTGERRKSDASCVLAWTRRARFRIRAACIARATAHNGTLGNSY